MADTSNLELIAGMNLKTEPFRAVLLEETGLYIFTQEKIWINLISGTGYI
jgi:hypothetical protein